MKTFGVWILVLFALLVCSPAFAQYAPGSTAVVNQQVVQSQPDMVPVRPMGPSQGVPQEWLANGYREQFTQTHDIYPFRSYNYPGAQVQAPCVNQTQIYQQPAATVWQYPQQSYQYQSPCYQQPTSYYYPTTGCWQQDSWPRTYQPQTWYCR